MAENGLSTSLARLVRRGGREVKTGLGNSGRVPLRRQLRAWTQGFYASNLRLYDVDRFGFAAFVSDCQRARMLAGLHGYRHVFDDKLVSSLYLKMIGAPTPIVFGTRHEGTWTFFDETGQRDGLPGLLRKHGRLVVKARSGSGGRRFAVLDQSDDTDPLLSCEVGPGRAPGDPLIVCEYVPQHPYAAAVFPESTNTLRLLTLVDPDDGRPFVVMALHRFGTHRSRPVDNAARGGVAAAVDLASGTLDRLVLIPARSSAPLVWSDRHPDTGAVVRGTQVPRWPAVVAEVCRAAAFFPGAHFVGWDVVVTPDGMSILEANNRPDITSQVFRPLLLDERARRAFASRGITSTRRWRRPG